MSLKKQLTYIVAVSTKQWIFGVYVCQNNATINYEKVKSAWKFYLQMFKIQRWAPMFANVYLPKFWYANIVPMFNHVVLMSWCFSKKLTLASIFSCRCSKTQHLVPMFGYVMLCQCLTMFIAVCQHCINVLATLLQ